MGSVIKIVASVLSAFSLFWLGIGVTEYWEHRPGGVPSFSFKVLWWPVSFKAPDSLAAQRDKARDQLATCEFSKDQLERSLAVQNNAILAFENDTIRMNDALKISRAQASRNRVLSNDRVNEIDEFQGKTCQDAERLIRETVK